MLIYIYIYIYRERERERERELRKLLKTKITFQGILFIYNFELLAAIYIFCSITLYFWNVKQCSLFCLEETYLHKGKTLLYPMFGLGEMEGEEREVEGEVAGIPATFPFLPFHSKQTLNG